MALALVAGAPAWATEVPATRDARVLHCLALINQERYAEVPACAAELKRLYPEHAAGAFVAATAHQTRMSDYRVRRFEADFEREIAEAQAKAERSVRLDPSAENQFILGAVEGYRCVYWFRQGKWLKAVRAALRGMSRLSDARRADPALVDPLMGLGLYTHAKGKVRLLGIGLFGRHEAETESMLLEAEARARFVSVNARYALQYVLVDRGEYARALPVNERLFAEFPRNPVCLYNRGLILEALGRAPEATPIWRRLIDVIYDSGLPSRGFLAECHLHLGTIAESSGDSETAALLLARAKAHADSRRPAEEIDGPYRDSEDIRAEIERAYAPQRRASAGDR